MRITNHGIIETVVANVQRRLKSLAEVEGQMSSGIRVAKPSDDPAAAGRVLELNSLLRRTDQWRRNISAGLASLRATENLVSQAHEIIVRARARAVEGANDGLGAADRRAIAAEVDGMLRDLIAVANHRLGSRYLFGSGWSEQPPYRITEGGDGWVAAVEPNFDGSIRPLAQSIGAGRKMEITISADDAFNLGEGGSLFGILLNLRDALASDDADAVGAALPHLDEALENLAGLTAMLGGRVGAAQTAADRLADLMTIYQEELADVQDVDIVSTVTRFNEAKTAYEMALRTAASVIQPSLVQFLTP